MSSNVEYLQLPYSNLSDISLPKFLKLFANVEMLDLSYSNFTILPECLKECRFLYNLCLDGCNGLQEIRGIPTSLKYLSTKYCESLKSSCKSLLLNQELHEAGGTQFCIFSEGTVTIPNWFEHQTSRPEISFWFRNNLPSFAIFFASKLKDDNDMDFVCSIRVHVVINDYVYTIDFGSTHEFPEILVDHIYVFDLQLMNLKLKLWGIDTIREELEEFHFKLREALLKNEWIHVEVKYNYRMKEALLIESGIHIFKQESSMEDIQFTSPYKKRRLAYAETDIVLEI